MTFTPVDWECDLEGDDTCACSTSTECKCVAEPVCSGPLVGTLVDMDVECAECGAPMSTRAATPPAGAGAEAPHDWRQVPGTGWECAACMTKKRVAGAGELTDAFEYRQKGRRMWIELPPLCRAPAGTGGRR